ncbi:DUF4266 domain-containing protein [Marinomonas sp. A79]|uniref:DUF4266 domain-containing protein n=1 Tax=Marinomonas vulgaris TaxID=2823372 RepID=A0ABS5HER7_9GAMM|nr:DUF4266 domain-containing protein [Marinomonas vulgaris]MBR7890105.1 DUF4266 domain-containing protein [Marinomonas vulgaris]
MSKRFVLLSLVGVVITTTGCSEMGVKAWERETLAQQEMSLINEPVESSLNDHVYFSKEASSGGQGFGGGGCGCN